MKYKQPNGKSKTVHSLPRIRTQLKTNDKTTRMRISYDILATGIPIDYTLPNDVYQHSHISAV